MRFLTLAALGLSLIAPALASPIDGSVTTNLTTAPSTNQTVPFANQTVSVRQIRPPKVDPPLYPRPECKRKTGIFRDWTVIKIPKIPDNVTTGAVCAKLWAGLKGHFECAVTSPHGCDISGNKGEADVEWWFHSPIICHKTAIEAAFNWATGEKYGGKLICVDHH